MVFCLSQKQNFDLSSSTIVGVHIFHSFLLKMEGRLEPNEAYLVNSPLLHLIDPKEIENSEFRILNLTCSII
jgi:hypothetical protein